MKYPFIIETIKLPKNEYMYIINVPDFNIELKHSNKDELISVVKESIQNLISSNAEFLPKPYKVKDLDLNNFQKDKSKLSRMEIIEIDFKISKPQNDFADPDFDQTKKIDETDTFKFDNTYVEDKSDDSEKIIKEENLNDTTNSNDIEIKKLKKEIEGLTMELNKVSGKTNLDTPHEKNDNVSYYDKKIDIENNLDLVSLTNEIENLKLQLDGANIENSVNNDLDADYESKKILDDNISLNNVLNFNAKENNEIDNEDLIKLTKEIEDLKLQLDGANIENSVNNDLDADYESEKILNDTSSLNIPLDFNAKENNEIDNADLIKLTNEIENLKLQLELVDNEKIEEKNNRGEISKLTDEIKKIEDNIQKTQESIVHTSILELENSIANNDDETNIQKNNNLIKNSKLNDGQLIQSPKSRQLILEGREQLNEDYQKHDFLVDKNSEINNSKITTKRNIYEEDEHENFEMHNFEVSENISKNESKIKNEPQLDFDDKNEQYESRQISEIQYKSQNNENANNNIKNDLLNSKNNFAELSSQTNKNQDLLHHEFTKDLDNNKNIAKETNIKDEAKSTQTIKSNEEINKLLIISNSLKNQLAEKKWIASQKKELTTNKKWTTNSVERKNLKTSLTKNARNINVSQKVRRNVTIPVFLDNYIKDMGSKFNFSKWITNEFINEFITKKQK